MGYNGSVVGKVGELAATSLSHVKNKPKIRKTLGICVISPNFFNHVLCPAVFCEEYLSSGREKVSLDFKFIHGLNTFLKTEVFSTVAGSPDGNFFCAFFWKFLSLSFQGFLGIKNVSEWWVGYSVHSAFNASRNKIFSAFPFPFLGGFQGRERLSTVDERQGKIASRSSKVRPLVRLIWFHGVFDRHTFLGTSLSKRGTVCR